MSEKKRLKKKISIIVVSYNTKKKFEKTISSIKSQSFQNYEIIVVDGKSSDGTIDIIKKKKKLFQKIIIEKDLGIYDAMNKGINISKSDWIFFLNSGDIFFNNNVLMKIQKYLKKKNDFIYGSVAVKSAKLSYIINAKNFNRNSLIIPFSHQGIFSSNKLLRKKNFDLSFKIAADFELFYYFLNKKKTFCKVNEIISFIEPLGISDRKRILAYSEYQRISLKYSNSNFIKLQFKFFFLKILITWLIKYVLPENVINSTKYQKYRLQLIKN